MNDFSTITERAGDPVPQWQIDQMHHRYAWAARFCRDKDVIEVACGTGQGLGLLNGVAASLRAGDYTEANLDVARAHYGDRLQLEKLNAEKMPYEDQSADVVVIFEALYYLLNPDAFAAECRRILRPGGSVLITNANKDLFDFNPSPFSQTYHGTVELARLFAPHGFSVTCYGRLPVAEAGLLKRCLRGVKSVASRLGLIPKTMKGKRILKRLLFGKLTTMPAEIGPRDTPLEPVRQISTETPDTRHQFIYCVATRQDAT
jgi:SAM-dependent methyltransferase